MADDMRTRYMHMEEKKYTSDEPIRIVVFEKSGTPRQFKLEHSVRIGYGRP